MKFQFYYEKLTSFDEFQKFIKENKDAYPCTGFFSINRDTSKEEDVVSIEYYVPSTKKMASFKVSGKMAMVYVENLDPRVPEKLSMNYDFDLNNFEIMIQKRMEKDAIKGRIQKLIYSLQKYEKKDYLLGTIFLSNMGLLKVHIDLEENEITFFEKKSFFDLLKIHKGKKSDDKDEEVKEKEEPKEKS